MGEPIRGDNNIIHILENFKVNTDAQAPIQGFYYQYLITLNDWLDYYIDKRDVVIYCETEDDIKAEDLLQKHVSFTQVKAYSKKFDIKAEEVRKSIVNFFQLFFEYRNKGISSSFIFHTNTDFEGEFFQITNDVPQISSIEKEKCIEEIKKVLISEFEKKNKKILEKLEKLITEADEYISKNPNPTLKQQDKYNRLKKQYEEKLEEKEKLLNDFTELKEFIHNKAPTFIDTIEWKAEKKYKEDSISEFIKSIEKKIAKIDGFKLDIDSAYAHLINRVLVASQASDIEKRRLDSKMIDNLIQKASDIDNFKKDLQSAELLMTFSKLIQALRKIETKIDSISSDTKRILVAVEKKDNSKIIPNNFNTICNEIFLLHGMEENEKELIRDRLKYIAESSTKYLIPLKIKEYFSTELLVNEQDIDELTNKELWSMYLEFIVISILLDECSPINILAIEEIYKKRKFLFAKAVDWIELKKDILYSDLTRLKKGGTVIVCCDGDRKPTRCTIKNSTLHDISRGLIPEKMKIDSGIESPYKDFKFKHIHIVQKQMIEDNENSDIFDDLDVQSVEKVIKDEIRKVLD